MHGVVFDDRNGNGTRDSGEIGIAAVQVSDGVTIVQTDAEGRYELDAADHAIVFVIKPRGWSVRLSPQQRPRFYFSPWTDAGTDFALTKKAEPDRFQVLLLADPQPASIKEIGYFDRTIAQKLAGSKDFAFSVTLGDIVYDHPELYLPFDDAMAKIGIPSYNVIGNHDLSYGVSRERDTTVSFELRYGPTTYAFHYGGA
ncbi:MAG: calcineurin phosphoesterase, partial [Verrucomicrobia bacterium]|nr:calcineurin phosphoesterase [Verrucomicrobiota bacterium]